jgi:Spy/CpxP family protein refolding chaperone
MKKLGLVLFIAILAMGSVFAQPGGDPAERLQREIDGLKTELGLSADQVAKVTPILTAASAKQREEMTKMFDGGGFDRDKMMAFRTKSQAETDALLKAVLTPEQVTKLATYRKTQAEEMAKRMQQMGGN